MTEVAIAVLQSTVKSEESDDALLSTTLPTLPTDSKLSFDSHSIFSSFKKLYINTPSLQNDTSIDQNAREHLRDSTTSSRHRHRTCPKQSKQHVHPLLLRKYNSCSTLFVDYDVMQADWKYLTKCLSRFVQHQIKTTLEQRRFHVHSVLLTPSYRQICSSYCNSQQPPSPVFFEYCVPSENEIYSLLESIFQNAELTAEVAIMTLAYISRMVRKTGVSWHPFTWKHILLGALMIAAKVSDDQAIWTIDFVSFLPENTLQDMRDLENFYLTSLDFHIHLDRSSYVKYYFLLRYGDVHCEIFYDEMKLESPQDVVSFSVGFPVHRTSLAVKPDLISDVFSHLFSPSYLQAQKKERIHVMIQAEKQFYQKFDQTVQTQQGHRDRKCSLKEDNCLLSGRGLFDVSYNAGYADALKHRKSIENFYSSTYVCGFHNASTEYANEHRDI